MHSFPSVRLPKLPQALAQASSTQVLSCKQVLSRKWQPSGAALCMQENVRQVPSFNILHEY